MAIKQIKSILLFVLLSATISATEANSANKISQQDIEKFAIVMAQIKHYYIKDTTSSSLFDNAIKGMLTNLDPHSSYLTEEDFKEMDLQTTGKYGGIGIQIIPENGLIKIITPLDDTPAAKANIEPGDIILKINNIFVKDLGPNKAVNMLLGKPKTKVKLTIYKNSLKKPITLTLTREIIKAHSVKGKLIANDIAYLRISHFNDNTAAEIKKNLKKLKTKVNSLILDIRNNPGGTLDSAIAVSDLFLDANKLKTNKTIVKTSGKIAEMNSVAEATTGEIFNNKPIVVLINSGSASAAEILASALAEHNRAITLGTKTFGKGSIQTLIPVTHNSAIKITTGLYYTPRGKAIQASGVSPDVIVPYTTMPKESNQQNIENFIDESQLYKHLKTKPKTKKPTTKDKSQHKINIAIANKDFQLYQAIKILHGLIAMHD